MTPTCDTCEAVDETVEWCGSCGSCLIHCQDYEDCPSGGSELTLTQTTA